MGEELQSGEHTGFLARVVSVLRPNFVEYLCTLIGGDGYHPLPLFIPWACAYFYLPVTVLCACI